MPLAVFELRCNISCRSTEHQFNFRRFSLIIRYAFSLQYDIRFIFRKRVHYITKSAFTIPILTINNCHITKIYATSYSLGEVTNTLYQFYFF